MCGRIGNVIDSPDVRTLLQSLGVIKEIKTRSNVPPFGLYEIVIERDNAKRRLVDAVWSVLIETKEGGGYRAVKNRNTKQSYSSFNAKAERLQSSPIWKGLYQSHRAIVPIDYFYEWQDGTCYAISAPAGAIALGGLHRQLQFGDETVDTFAVITLPGHPKLAHIHAKSIPLMLTAAEYDAWLDPTFTHVDAFAELLKPHIPIDLQIQAVDSPDWMQPIGDAELVKAD